ncbi:TPA: hypothetical protein OUI54_004345 [Klebsiella variicola]|uniref:hypothetical protein n=1 Tax=Raoultella planticola TaxID=575 RepID=UPI001CCED21C|nr:hypothetical protein [Raoultella planticola]MBZ7833560.1 hypothetical protein [Raoultella planticola]HCU2192444.1 hypothetical protein [Klebsiella variicola]
MLWWLIANYRYESEEKSKKVEPDVSITLPPLPNENKISVKPKSFGWATLLSGSRSEKINSAHKILLKLFECVDISHIHLLFM